MCQGAEGIRMNFECLNESPSEKEGKLMTDDGEPVGMLSLNESPSEKEGKS